MTIETLKSPNPRDRNGISLIKSKLLSVPSMNTLLAILKVTDARRNVILAAGLYHRFPWRHPPPPPPLALIQHSACTLKATVRKLSVTIGSCQWVPFLHNTRGMNLGNGFLEGPLTVTASQMYICCSYLIPYYRKLTTKSHAVSGSFRLHDVIFTFDAGQT